MKRYDLIGGIVWLAVAVLVLNDSRDLGLGTLRQPGAGLFPLVTGALLAMFAILLLCEAVTKKSAGPAQEARVWDKDIRYVTLAIVLISIGLYGVLLDVLGFVVATFLFMLIMFKRVEPQAWITAFVASAVAVFASYVMFEWCLESQLPEGRLVAWLASFF
jgi:putative tricarboxylic transport membrane protein